MSHFYVIQHKEVTYNRVIWLFEAYHKFALFLLNSHTDRSISDIEVVA